MSVAEAGPADAIARSRFRPTVTDLVEALPEWPLFNPFECPNEADDIINALEAFPQSYAAFAALFPGGILAPLGRDAVYLGDFFEAYHLAHGRKGRVHRLDASRPSIDGETPEGLLRFLTKNGLDLRQDPMSQPYVIFDRTNYGSVSQARRLAQIAYEEFSKGGGHPFELVPFVNVLNSEHNLAPALESLAQAAPGLFRQQTQAIAAGGRNVLETALSLPHGNAFTDIGYEWHGSFGKLRRSRRGRWEGVAGELASLRDREMVLWFLYEITQRMFESDYQAKITKAIGVAGAKREKDGDESIPAIMARPWQWRNLSAEWDYELDAKIQSSGEDEGTREIIFEWLDTKRKKSPALRSLAALVAIKSAAVYHSWDTLAETQVLEVVDCALSMVEPDPIFVKALDQLVPYYRVLGRVLGTGASVYFTSQKEKLEAQAERLRLLQNSFDCARAISDEA